MSMRFITMKTDAAICTIMLNRPEKRNAINQEMIHELSHTLQSILHDNKVSVLIIKGNGETFSAGADIDWMRKIASSSDAENGADAHVLAKFLYQLYTFPKPTIALAHGVVLGGGLGMLCACDIAIAADDASFGFPEVSIGLAPSCISPYVLSAIGERQAKYYFLTGKRFDATTALHIGLVHKIIEFKDLSEGGLIVAKELLLNGPQALHAAKQLIQSIAHEKITEELIQKTAEHLARIRHSPEAQEGLQAFLEKRKKKWQL